MRQTLRGVSLLVAAFAGGMFASDAARAARSDTDDTYRTLAVFARVLNYVERNYVTPIAAQDLIYGAVRGMLASLDPHSVFLDPDQYAALQSEAQGEFGGIGVELVKRSDGVHVVERYAGAPAIKAGLLVGDVIISVDGRDIVGRSLTDVVARIKGPPNTAVQVGVRRHRSGQLESIVLRRERIRVVSVDGRRLDDDLGYVRIRLFTERTHEDLDQALRRLKASGAIRGLIVDLRDNPGGLLKEAVRVADLWLSRGLIVSTEGRQQPPELEMAHPKGTEPNYPMAVLVNGGTASAAEIVAGAMQDHARARLIGTQTFGKGSVQTVIEMEDRSALKLTIARYFTPKHRSISGVGITPDQVVPQSVADQPVVVPNTAGSSSDPQLQAATTYVREQLP